jgi:hypothetical protein
MPTPLSFEGKYFNQFITCSLKWQHARCNAEITASTRLMSTHYGIRGGLQLRLQTVQFKGDSNRGNPSA